jgi:hypothetical protein
MVRILNNVVSKYYATNGTKEKSGSCPDPWHRFPNQGTKSPVIARFDIIIL